MTEPTQTVSPVLRAEPDAAVGDGACSTFTSTCPYGCVVRTVGGHQEPHVCVGEQVIAALAPHAPFLTARAIAAGLQPLFREQLHGAWLDGVQAGRRGPCVGDDDVSDPGVLWRASVPAEAPAELVPCSRCGCTGLEACVLAGEPCYWVSKDPVPLCSACIDRPDGAELAAAERRRQIEVEGYTAEHDQRHTWSELVHAGNCYRDGVSAGWPWGWESWKPKNKIRDLIRASALYAAASERADLAVLRESSEASHAEVVYELDRLLVEVRTIDRRGAA